MKIAPYYQNLLEQALQAAASLEPITFAGMFDSGVDYLFNLFPPLINAEKPKNIETLILDISGLTDPKMIFQELNFVKSQKFQIPSAADYFALTTAIGKLTQKQKLVLVIYFGQENQADQEFLLLLNRLRNLSGWNFSYSLFLSTRVLFHQTDEQPLMDKVIKRNVVPVLPLDKSNSTVVLENYIERYQKPVSKSIAERIIQFSGGNPGLIKALYLQAVEKDNWLKADLLDERLFFRLQGIVTDLPVEYVSVFEKPVVNKNQPKIIYGLTRYGYLVKENDRLESFSPLVSEFLTNNSDLILQASSTDKTELDLVLNFTQSQRKLLKYLSQKPNQLVTKDEVAQVLWGQDWADKYSDWAIDQLIYTLREKIEKNKFQGKIITKKGEGIVFITK